MYLDTVEGDENVTPFEKVYAIYVKGNNKELGSSYKLEVPEGSEVSTLHKGEEGWKYISESQGYSYYDEEDNYISDTYYYTDRIMVKAPNGVERIYVIAYASNTPETEQ